MEWMGLELPKSNSHPKTLHNFHIYNTDNSTMVEIFYVYVDMPLEHHYLAPFRPLHKEKKTVSHNHDWDHTHTQPR